MNASEKLPLPSTLERGDIRGRALALFPLESLQSLNMESARHCQMMLEHGETFGLWATPEALVPHMKSHMRRVDFRKRITVYLPKETQTSPALGELLDEGVLWLTRMGLLMRMGAGAGIRAKFKPLNASTVAGRLYQADAKLVALGISRRLESTTNSNTGFTSALTADDLRTLWAKTESRLVLMRLTQLHALGFWSDAPASKDFKGKATPLRGTLIPRPPEHKPIPYPPIPDDYMAAMGPKVLWLIKDLGPNLLHLLETVPTMLRNVNPTHYNIYPRITRYFDTNVWSDRNGRVIEKPPFSLQHGSDSGKHFLDDSSQHDPFEWPPRHLSSVKTLASMLQNAHLWMALLVMAARIGEVATLRRDCVDFGRDGQLYANGKTYKASRALAGKDREWPMPNILVDVLAQQVKLVEACERLARMMEDSTEMADLLGDGKHLWASLGTSGSADATEKLVSYDKGLRMLAVRIGLSPKPGGKNLHPHRLRKTLARLAGLAIDGSQKVLMQLLGHDDVTTTLGYMQADRAFAKEVNDITRELRIMRGEALIEDMRAALRVPNSRPYGGHGGGGAPVLADTVRAYEEELHRSGQEWGVDTARELSVLLTNNGESARLISAHVVCTKTAGEVGLCSSKKGAIVAGNCQVECRNHIEDKTGRRDTERVIPILVQHAQKNIANNDWLPLQRDKKQLEQELKRYDDIGAKWRANPDVQSILQLAT
ncbi:MAG: site-specific integrase [Polaromonas sp.]|nr:site-specific integrase [Polaromonas sp.]